jgi:hypothetical protein
MGHLALRHWTAILIAAAIAAWAVLYLPQTPSWMIFNLKQAIDARDGSGAARYVDFQQVVRNAGYEAVQDQNGSNGGAGSLLGALVGRGAVDLLSGPMASLLQTWAIQQVDNGAKQVQLPPAAAAGAIAFLHRNGDVAYTSWRDHKGREWEVRMARETGGWKIVQVKNVEQLLEQLKRQQENQFNAAPPDGAPPPDSGTGTAPGSSD